MRNTAVPALGASLNHCETSGRGNILRLVLKFPLASKIVLTITFEETGFACKLSEKVDEPVPYSTETSLRSPCLSTGILLGQLKGVFTSSFTH